MRTRLKESLRQRKWNRTSDRRSSRNLNLLYMVRRVQFERRNTSSSSNRERGREGERERERERAVRLNEKLESPCTKVNPSPPRIIHCICFNLNESKISQEISFFRFSIESTWTRNSSSASRRKKKILLSIISASKSTFRIGHWTPDVEKSREKIASSNYLIKRSNNTYS